MKNIFRYVFAAALATTIYIANGAGNEASKIQEATYRIVDENHQNFNDEVDQTTAQQPENCPGGGLLCAEKISGPAEAPATLNWSGTAVKF